MKESGETPGRSLSPEESLRLFTAAEFNPDWMAAFCAAIIADDAGMRGFELKCLRLRDVDLDARKIDIRRSKNDSGVRTVILTNDAVKAMLKLLERAAQFNAHERIIFFSPTRCGRVLDMTASGINFYGRSDVGYRLFCWLGIRHNCSKGISTSIVYRGCA